MRNAATHLVFNWKHPRAEQQPSTETSARKRIDKVFLSESNFSKSLDSWTVPGRERERDSVREDATSASGQREREIGIEIRGKKEDAKSVSLSIISS